MISAKDRECTHLPFLPPRKRTQVLSAYSLASISPRPSYHSQQLPSISSKVDFFNSRNQHKLDLSTRKILRDVGAIQSPPKDRVHTLKIRNNFTPQLHMLLRNYSSCRKMNEEVEYCALRMD